MGKPTGFMDYERVDCRWLPPEQRLKNFDEFKRPLPEEEQRQQAARCMDCGVPFCQAGMLFGSAVSGCPLNNLIPDWNDLIYQGQWEAAYRRLSKTNNFPEFTGRVCPAPCEKACVCNLGGEPVTSHDNELAIIERAFSAGYVKPRIPEVRSGKRIAVIGSGPSGLAAADQLNHRGHSVTVFERSDRVGGLLMYGIPNMKLDKRVIARRVALMKEEGVTFKTNHDVGVNVDARALVAEYDAVILCCGASNPRDLKVPGRDAAGIHFAVDFLKANTKSLLDSDLSDGKAISARGKTVIVVGGGDTGNDCVGTCLRHGCKSVTQFEMMPCPPEVRDPVKNPWPQWPNVLKTDYGQQEAIYVQGEDPRRYCTTIQEFLKDKKGNLKGVRAVHLDWSGGKMQEQDSFEVKCDMVLIAAGFLGCQTYVSDAFGVALTPRTVVDTKNHQTSVPKVFAAGDMRRGQSLVVWGIREGRSVARAVDAYLMGYTNLD